jgi:hypothetical protein
MFQRRACRTVVSIWPFAHRVRCWRTTSVWTPALTTRHPVRSARGRLNPSARPNHAGRLGTMSFLAGLFPSGFGAGHSLTSRGGRLPVSGSVGGSRSGISCLVCFCGWLSGFVLGSGIAVFLSRDEQLLSAKVPVLPNGRADYASARSTVEAKLAARQILRRDRHHNDCPSSNTGGLRRASTLI